MEKGQIFSLDFVISLIMVFLAVGFALNFFELQTVNAKEAGQREELQNLGEGAARLLTSGEGIVCELKNQDRTQVLDYLPNCLTTAAGGRVTKANIGLPSGYECYFGLDPQYTLPQNFTDCTLVKLDIPSTGQVFSVTRKIVVIASAESVTKKELEDCVNAAGTCNLYGTDVNLAVWRS